MEGGHAEQGMQRFKVSNINCTRHLRTIMVAGCGVVKVAA